MSSTSGEIFSSTDRPFVETIAKLAYCNPFQQARLELENLALGSDFVDDGLVWSKDGRLGDERANISKLTDRLTRVVLQARESLHSATEDPDQETCELYADVVLFYLYHEIREPLSSLIREQTLRGGQTATVTFWEEFQERFNFFFRDLPWVDEDQLAADHWLAIFFQLRRAFHYTYHFVVGRSSAMSRLRAAIWQSIFTHDMRRYRRSLYKRMADITTLIVGPSGTGKELVARAIGMSRYIPFDRKQQKFSASFIDSFCPVNLSALSETLIESELFGHARGSFTGAVADRAGWLERCGDFGTVFLDEIGELAIPIQVKLLRVLQERVFQRLGETESLAFRGKIIAATNRDLGQEMQECRFRQDLYYRICSDIIATAPLSQQLAESPEDLELLCVHIAGRMAFSEAASVADEAVNWIRSHLPSDYSWPGNIRELEQCVRNVLVRGSYAPVEQSSLDESDDDALFNATEQATLTADQLLQRYCTLLYFRLGGYEPAARRLGIDRRTVKAKVDPQLLARLQRPEQND